MGLYHPATARAIAEPREPPKKRWTGNFNDLSEKTSSRSSIACSLSLPGNLNGTPRAWLLRLICLIKGCLVRCAVGPRLRRAVRLSPPANLEEGKARDGVTLSFCISDRFWTFFPGICRRGHFSSRVVLRRSVLRREIQRLDGGGLGAQQGRHGGRD